MDDFSMFARDLGYRPQGKAAPMKSTSGSDAVDRSRDRSSPFATDDQNRDGPLFNDVFGGPPKYSSSTNNSSKTSGMSEFDYDSIFKNSSGANEPKSKSTSSSSTLPVYDKPVYDDDIFDGLPGIKSKSMSSSSPRYEENIFASMVSPPKRSQQNDQFDDLLGNLGRTDKVDRKSNYNSKSPAGFDDLIPGFGSGSPAVTNRSNSGPSQIPKQSGTTKEVSSSVMEDPFVVLGSTSTPGASSPGLFTDPLEDISKLNKPGSAKAGGSSPSTGVFDDIDPLNGFGKSAPSFSSDNGRAKDRSPLKEGSTMGRMQNSTNREPFENASSKYSDSQKKVPVDDFLQSHQSPFDMPPVSRAAQKSIDPTAPPYANYNESAPQVDMSPRSEEYMAPSDDIWLTVSEIPLLTQPTRAPPPSRPPPSIPRHTSRSERGSFASNSRRKGGDFSSSPNSVQYSQSPRTFQQTVKSPLSSPVDELENFAMGRMPNNVDENVDNLGEEMDSNSAAAAMKVAMDRAEAKFRHAKEVREREHAKAARSKEAVQLDRDEETTEESQEGELRENQERLERERRQREREEEEREQRRLEKERAREIEREKGRQAVERATREVRERAATDARERAAAEARLKVERAAVQRAQAEARERAAVEARERAERAAVEARERAAAEARERAAAEAREKEVRDKAAIARAEADARRRAERAAVDRVAAEARERAAVEARERAAAAARMNQQKNDNDLESFFSMNSRPSSAPRPRASSSDPASDPQSQSRGGPEGPRKTSSTGVSSNMRKASSTTNIVDDLSSIFGAAASAGDFQDVEGETEERRRARLERHQRTQDRAAKALAEKNQRDLQTQRDQEERHRIADTLDIEIKRWAAGKDGNLRALLSTLQYVLWPECGWQPVSLTDLITGASVKKAYRKATLCIHPDKVQQKGANLQQKYVAEKVFDLLKEAWNKFNSEELF